MSIRNNYRGHNYIRIGEKITQRVIRSAAFDTISVSGQDDIAATSSQSLTMAVVNSGLTLTTNASTDTLTFTVDAGTDTTQGALELATDTEAVAGTDTARAVTPASLTARLASPGDIGGTIPATDLSVDNINVDGNTISSTNGDLQLKAVSGSSLTLQDDADATKELTLDMASISTSTERTWTFPNSSDTFVGLSATQTLSAKTLTSPVLNGTLSGDAFLDEDGMISNSATKVASQQSIKAYVDNSGGATIGFAIAMAVAL